MRILRVLVWALLALLVCSESVRISLQATNAKGAGHASAVIRLRR